MDLVVQFIVAVFATIAFAVLFSVPKKELALKNKTARIKDIIVIVLLFFSTPKSIPPKGIAHFKNKIKSVSKAFGWK